MIRSREGRSWPIAIGARIPRKRWLASANRTDDTWEIALPEPVGDTSDLLTRLSRRADGGVILRVRLSDRAARRLRVKDRIPRFSRGARPFSHGDWQARYDVCEDVKQVSRFRAFYPSRPGGRARAQLFDQLGLPGEHLLRLCERAASERQAPCILFWTLGGNQVGKAAITAWREVLVPNLDRIGIWPFDGTLDAALDESPNAIVVETYPGEAYGHLGIPRKPAWSKRQQEGALAASARTCCFGWPLGWSTAGDRREAPHTAP